MGVDPKKGLKSQVIAELANLLLHKIASSQVEEKFYTPNPVLKSPRVLLGGMLKDLKLSRELSWALAMRELKAMYRQSILGYVWAFLPPLGTSAVFLFLRSGSSFSVESGAIPYPVFILTGTLLWQVFVDAVNGPLKIVTASRAMLVKINFPRESLILAGAQITIFNFLIRLLILLPALFYFGSKGLYDFHVSSLVLFPLGVAGIMILGYAIGILLTPVGMLFKDVAMGVIMVMAFWMFLTPVVMTVPNEGMVAWIMNANPATPVIDAARCWLLGYPFANLVGFLVVVSVSLLAVILGWIGYRVAMPHVIARLGM